MTKRFTYNALIGFGLLLFGLAMAFAIFSWPALLDPQSAVQLFLTWFLLPLVIMLALFAIGYSLWKLTHQRQKSQLQTEILHSLVHEFQTPIAAIRMAADVMALPMTKASPERTEKYLRIIREETERMQHQVETMLSLARADENMLIVSTEPVDVHQLLQSVAERHGAYLELCLQADNPLLQADRLHLTNILHNLLDNALKYSVGDPEIRFMTLSDSSGLTISIRDRGIGIPPHLKSRIFQPFFRVQGNNQPSVKGFGLGLSYVQRIVQAHKWRIELTSEVGQGSEFFIRVPATALVSSLPAQTSLSSRQ